MIKLPIIIDEHGDISVFMSIAEASDYIEPIDVRNNEYLAYDSEGRCLELSIESEIIKGIFNRSINQEKVQITASSVTDSCNLSIKIRLFLEAIGNSVSTKATLPELVKMLKALTKC